MFRISKLVLWVVISWAFYNALNIYRRLYEIPPVPTLADNVWWGPGEPKNLTESIRLFKIIPNDEVISDLHERIDRFLNQKRTPALENSAFLYGFNRDYLISVVKYWRNDYDWKKRVNYLNKYPQFKTYVNGLDLHFLHVVPENPGRKTVLPLLLLHGWPGSVREFYEMIPFLTAMRNDTDFVFELVIPSLPGYGFSQGSSKPGFGAAQMAVVLKNLMGRLGFDEFYVQGGDWGAQLAKYLGVLYPQKILGIHGNMCFALNFQIPLKWILGSYFPFFTTEAEHYEKLYPLLPKVLFILEELGYLHVQASKPDTIVENIDYHLFNWTFTFMLGWKPTLWISSSNEWCICGRQRCRAYQEPFGGAALEDSPVGLAAYILEKFSTWTNRDWKYLEDGGLTKKYSLDALLDNVMLYWVTGCITTSQRLYAETFNVTQIYLRLEEIPLQVPTACARFPQEMFWLSKPLLKGIFVNLVRLTDFEEGGHFPALEAPQILSEDIWKAVKAFRQLKETSSQK